MPAFFDMRPKEPLLYPANFLFKMNSTGSRSIPELNINNPRKDKLVTQINYACSTAPPRLNILPFTIGLFGSDYFNLFKNIAKKAKENFNKLNNLLYDASNNIDILDKINLINDTGYNQSNALLEDICSKSEYSITDQISLKIQLLLNSEDNLNINKIYNNFILSKPSNIFIVVLIILGIIFIVLIIWMSVF